MGPMKKIFILHGWTYGKPFEENRLVEWASFIQGFKAHGFNVELLKVPGLTQDINRIYTLDSYVNWLKKILSKESNKVILIGHSNGGRIAAAFTQKYPEKVEHLILIDSAGIVHNELHNRIKRGVFRAIAKVGKKLTNSEKLKVLLYKLAREGDYKNANEFQRKTMLNLIYLDLKEVFKKIMVPTLIIWGKQDKITPLYDGKLINKLISNSELFIIDGASHSPQFTNPNAVVNIIRDCFGPGLAMTENGKLAMTKGKNGGI